MTMFPPARRQNHLINNKNTTTSNYYGTTAYEYGGGCGYNYDQSVFSNLSGGGGGSDLDLIMADDDEQQQQQGEYSRTEINNSNNINKDEEETTTGSTSKDITNININQDDDDEEMMIKKQEEEEDGDEWLQLSLGITTAGRRLRRPPSDLDLLPAAGSTSSGGGGETNLSLTLTAAAAPRRQQQQQQLNFQVPITTTAAAAGGLFLQADERGWAVAAHPMALTTTTPHQQYQYQYQEYYMAPLLIRPMTTSASLGQAGGRSPLIDGSPPLIGRMDYRRVVDPTPARPHSGLWFILQPSLNQIKEPYLPQLPKSYLRIKDGRKTTVGLVIKYLVDKLNLDSQFQIEITCKGQQLLPFLTLQHVRDNIWNRSRNDVVFSPSSTTIIDHLMVLNYGRIA